MTKDHSDLVLGYNVATGKGRGDKAATSKVTLANRVAERPIQGQSFAKGQAGQRRLESDVDFHDDSTSSIQYDDNGPGSVVLLQVEFKENGKKYYRSIIAETELPPPDVGTFVLDSADVNGNGDLDLYFSGLPTGTVMLKAVILIELRNKAVPNGKVEITGIVDDGHLVVHGGWIRNALEGARETTNGSTNGWKLFVDEAEAYDTSGTTVLSRLGDKIEPVVAGDKQALAHTPSADEKGVSKDMIMGRRPVEEQPNDLRSRTLNTGLHKKILVHGYCASGNPWPQNQFSNFEVFSDPDARRQLGGGGGGNNWSNDLFAQKILSFAQNKNLHGCGIIAHSQGGLAALHMYTYYWSCLDYASSPNRMIQSVGSPYLGTPLAGNLAALGNIFGAGCGSQNDLTTSGAAAWLSNIPSWARSQVHYYTTSFKDRWWAYDYCHLATDLLLSDPDDGTTERYRGQLSGGINRGHKTNQCHTTGMRDTAQYFDQSRNSDMNSNASV